ncbi:MAG: hypothetical protein KA264_05350 [Crocinitomicaceae bacterium]|nr:hypothetical protein [Crocinitomicaceae bacterium]
MKKRKGNYLLQRLIKKTILGISLLLFTAGVAQTNVLKEFKLISFGEKLKFSNVNQNTDFKVVDLITKQEFFFHGNEINNYAFETPGSFEITIKHDHIDNSEECEHNSLPELLMLRVSPYKMEFDFSTLSFTKNIQSGVWLDNIELSVNINFTSFDKTQAVFDQGQITTAGIGTTILGKLKNNSIVLLPGTNKLIYTISGSATKETYIMFDFLDINSQIKSYNYPIKL